jgi:hypothetical protein
MTDEKTLIIHLSGDIRKITEAEGTIRTGVPPHIVALDEKTIFKPGIMRKLLRKEKFVSMYFACKDLSLQRYKALLCFWLTASGSRTAMIIDEQGEKEIAGIFKLVVLKLPHLVVEICAGILLIAYYRIYLMFRQISGKP